MTVSQITCSLNALTLNEENNKKIGFNKITPVGVIRKFILAQNLGLQPRIWSNEADHITKNSNFIHYCISLSSQNSGSEEKDLRRYLKPPISKHMPIGVINTKENLHFVIKA